MKRTKNLIVIGVLSFVCWGCTQSEPTLTVHLTEAERLTWENADSALRIIQSIPSPESLKGKQRADYALLLSHLQYRCYLPLTSDSLINIALEHYKDSKDWNKRGTTWYMKGIIWEEVYANIPEAINAYIQAEKCIPQMADKHLPGRIYKGLGLLNKKTLNFDLMTEYYKKALDFDLKYSDVSAQAWDWLNLLSAYLITHNTDSIHWSLNQLQETVTSIKDSILLAKVYHNLAIGKEYLGDTTQMESLLLKALQLTPQQPSYKTLSQLARFYLRQGKEEKADSLYQQVLKTSDLPTQSTVYNALHKEALKNKEYEKAARYASTFIDIQKAYYKESQHKETLEIQKKYDYMEVQYQSALKEKRLYLVILLLLVTAITTFCAFRLYIRRLQKQHNRVVADIAQLEDELMEARKQGDAHQAKAEELEAQIIEKGKELSGLANRMKLLSRLDTSLLSADNVQMMEVVLTLMEKHTCDLKHDRIYIRKWVSLSKPGLVERLQAIRPPLKEQYIDICCLLAMGLSIKETAQALGVSPTTVDRYLSQIGTERQLGTGGKKGFLAWFNEMAGVKG